MTLDLRIAELIINELVVSEGGALRFVWGEVQKATQYQKGVVLMEDFQVNHVLHLNYETGDPLSKDLSRTLQFRVQGCAGFVRRKSSQQPLP